MPLNPIMKHEIPDYIAEGSAADVGDWPPVWMGLKRSRKNLALSRKKESRKVRADRKRSRK